jgi:hypothetical protein
MVPTNKAEQIGLELKSRVLGSKRAENRPRPRGDTNLRGIFVLPLRHHDPNTPQIVRGALH